jgi:sulfate transport system substrate-binding protein
VAEDAPMIELSSSPSRRGVLTGAIGGAALVGAAALPGAALAARGPIKLLNVSYDPTRELYKAFNAAFADFWKKRINEDVTISQSHGGSGAQARSVIDGLEADVVTLALAYDIDAIADKGLIAKNWQSRLPYNSSPYTSTIVFLVRKGNPKGIHDWGDLLKPGVQVITPNPFTSGSARWNILAGYGAESDKGADQAKGVAYLRALFKNVVVQDDSGRKATQTFTSGKGDALLSYENEAIFAQRNGRALDYTIPPATILIESPVAVTRTSVHPAQAKAFLDFLYSPTAQKIFVDNGYRPVVAGIPGGDAFPTPRQLFTINDLGGWTKVTSAFFDPNTGIVAQIEKSNGVSIVKPTATPTATAG